MITRALQNAQNLAPVDLYSPPSLCGLERAPIFGFRPREPRDAALFAYFTNSNRLVAASDAEIRVAVFGILQKRWAPETFAAEYPKITDLWSRSDRGDPLATGEQETLDDLIARCREVSPHLDLMIVGNEQFKSEAPSCYGCQAFFGCVRRDSLAAALYSHILIGRRSDGQTVIGQWAGSP